MAENKIQTVSTFINKISELTDTTLTTIITVDDSNAQRIDGILVSSKADADIDISLFINDGVEEDDMPLHKITIPDGSGYNGTDPPVDLADEIDEFFKQLDNPGNMLFNIAPGAVLKVQLSEVPSDSLFVLLYGAKYD